MTVQVLLFAAARDWAKAGRLELSLPEGSCARDLLAAPALAGLAERVPALRLAVNEEFADPHTPLREGDVVAVLPPVSGG